MPEKKNIEEYKAEIDNVLDSWALNPHARMEKLLEVNLWLNQFKPSDLKSAIEILKQIQYYDNNTLKSIVTLLAKYIKNRLEKNLDEALFFPLGTNGASSGGQFLYSYNQELRVDTNTFPQDSFENYLQRDLDIYFFDDMIASGNQAISFYKVHLQNRKAKCYYVALLGLDKGVNKIRKAKLYDDIIVGKEISSELMAFTKESRLFEDDKKKKIKKMCVKYGKKLYEYPLGYDNTQALIVFEHNTPNNTLPIIWASADNESLNFSTVWCPLWNRKKRWPPKRNLYKELIEICNDCLSRYESVECQENTSFKSYIIKDVLYLKIEKDCFWNESGRVFIWMYKTPPISYYNSSFNGLITINTNGKGIVFNNLGLFITRCDTTIEYPNFNSFFNDFKTCILNSYLTQIP